MCLQSWITDIYWDLNFTNHIHFQSLEVVYRGSETQLRVAENLNWIDQWFVETVANCQQSPICPQTPHSCVQSCYNTHRDHHCYNTILDWNNKGRKYHQRMMSHVPICNSPWPHAICDTLLRKITYVTPLKWNQNDLLRGNVSPLQAINGYCSQQIEEYYVIIAACDFVYYCYGFVS